MPSLHQRAPGVWTLRVNDGRDPVDGKRVVRVETFKGSERKARARLADFDREVHRNVVAGGDTTLRKTIALWRAKAQHADSTSRNYDLAERTIPAHLMKTPVNKIRTATIEALVDKVKADHGIERARLVQAVVSGALAHAWRQEWLPTNVGLKVQYPAPKKRRDTTPTVAEVQRLLDLLGDRHQMYAWILLSAMVGGRPSEILALRWSDIDIEHAQVTISKALDPIKGGLKATKTETERPVAIGAKTIAALEVWRETFKANAKQAHQRPVRDPFVFVRPRTFDGATPWRPDYGSKEFRKLRDRSGINPKARRYDLRHMVATILLDDGVSLKAVGDRLGHTRLATTSDKYGHRVRASDQASADILERGLTG